MDIARLARRQLDDYDRHQPGRLFAGYPIAMTVSDAYAVQMAVARLRVKRGEPVAGYKIGCISPVIQAQLGIDRPVFGFVFGTEIRRSGAILNPDEFDGLAVEGEFAVRIGRDVPDATCLASHMDEAISSGFAVMELHNYVFRNTPHNAQELIGNNAMHAGVVMPAKEPLFNMPSPPQDASIQVSKNGEILGNANRRSLPEGLFGRVARLVEHLTEFGQFLQHGQIVLTGSPLPLYRVTGGDHIEVSCDRSGTVAATVLRAVTDSDGS